MKIYIKLLSLVFLPGLIFLFLTAGSQAQSNTPVVFVSRNIVNGGNIYYPAESLLPGMGPYSRFKIVGGRLLIRQSNGTVVVLIDSTINFNGVHIFDVQSPCVFWDASKILFSGVESRDSSWRIYEIHSDGTNFRKITFTNRNISLAQFGPAANKFQRYDDIDPCYLPDGRICFASTRYPSLNELTAAQTTNLYLLKSDLSSMFRLTTERNGAEKPTIDPVRGKIVYSRYWLNIDMASIITPSGLTRDSALSFNKDAANVWQTASINSDGEALDIYAGTANYRPGMDNYRSIVMNDGKMIGVFIPSQSMTYTSGSPGIRWFNKGMDYTHYIAGVNQNNMQLYIQNPPSYGTMQPPYATDPVEMPDGRILFSYASVVENQDFGLYIINLDGTGIQPFFDIPGKMELNAQILLPKNVPPVIPDLNPDTSIELPPTIDPSTYFKNGGFRFDCANMFFNGKVDQPMQDAPPITKFAKINFYMNFQRQDTLGRDSSIFLDSRPVQFSGQINFDFAPADIPLFEQVVDSAGKVIHGSSGQVAHVSGLNFGRPGTGTKCVGCHAGHTNIVVPADLSQAQFFNISTSATVTQSSFLFINDSLQFPGGRVIDRKAQNDTLTVNWIANGTTNEFVDLRWPIPIDAKFVVLYNIMPNVNNNTNIQVTDCEVFGYSNGSQVAHIPSTGAIIPAGSKFFFNGGSQVTMDEVKVIVKSYTGLVNGLNKAGLAEVETNARISFYEIFGIKQLSQIADKFSLSQNYPNPFNPATIIKFTVPLLSQGGVSRRDGVVSLKIYDVLGKEIATLVDEQLKPGSYEAQWNGSNFASGIYFYQLVVGDNTNNGGEFHETKKMVLVK